MAGFGRKVFTRERATSADVQGYLMDQAVMRFPSASAAAVAIPSPSEGMHRYLDDVNRTEFYDGSAWRPLFETVRASQGVAFGPAPPVGTQLIMLAYSAIVLTNSNGNSNIPFPITFPNGVLSVVLSSGDTTAGNHAIAAPFGVPSTSIAFGSHYQPNGTPCASVNVRVNVIAVGW